MSEVKRYDLVGDMDGNCNLNEARIELSDDGVYAKHRDYEALQHKCAALAAESAGMKKFCKDAAFDADYEAELGMERGGFSDALNEIKTPATDAFLDEIRAQGVEMFAQWCRGERDFTLIDEDIADAAAYEECVKRAEYFSAQLRKGGEQK